MQVDKDAEPLAEGAVLLHGFASDRSQLLIASLVEVIAASPYRHMSVRGGHKMSVAMTNCGNFGWVSDETGYRYDPLDPLTGRAWPPMPEPFGELAAEAALAARFGAFEPDACLINRYQPGAQMGLHQDKNEEDLSAPIVSVSLGLPAVFLFGGLRRSDRPRRIQLQSGDVVVWGGPLRLAYHGVARLAPGDHPLTGPCRINLTFRKAA
ncbi:MAG: DNA oxidative demethylase AlkB [Acidobacteriota bacterium]|nr:DNA oxidative demethylase AlkB [Acidobacteriota bacterium]